MPCNGTAAITAEIPGQVMIRVETDGPGLLVLADGWYEGWEAEVNGQSAGTSGGSRASGSDRANRGKSGSLHLPATCLEARGRLTLISIIGLGCWCVGSRIHPGNRVAGAPKTRGGSSLLHHQIVDVDHWGRLGFRARMVYPRQSSPPGPRSEMFPRIAHSTNTGDESSPINRFTCLRASPPP